MWWRLVAAMAWVAAGLLLLLLALVMALPEALSAAAADSAAPLVDAGSPVEQSKKGNSSGSTRAEKAAKRPEA